MVSFFDGYFCPEFGEAIQKIRGILEGGGVRKSVTWIFQLFKTLIFKLFEYMKDKNKAFTLYYLVICLKDKTI